MDRVIRFYKQQIDFLDSPAWLRGFVGGRGAGKSTVGAFDLVQRGKPGRLYMVVAPNFAQLAGSTFRSVIEMAQALGVLKRFKKGEPPEAVLTNGAEVIFRSGDDPESLRGPNLTGVWLDEASLMERAVFDICIASLRQGGEQGWLSSTFTPKGTLHWTYEVFGKGMAGAELFQARTSDNPFLPKGFEDRIAPTYTRFLQDQELGGLFKDAAGDHFTPGSWPKYEYLPGGRWERWKVGDRIWDRPELISLVGGDWAATDKESSDRTAFVGGLMTPGPRFDLLVSDVVAAKLKIASAYGGPDALLERLCRKWVPTAVATDDDVLARVMQEQCRRHQSIPPIQLLKIGGRGKLDRATEAINEGEQGRIWLPDEAPWLSDFCAVLSSFTGRNKREADDEVDALGLLVRLARQFRPGSGGDEVVEVLPVYSSRHRLDPSQGHNHHRLFPRGRR